MIMVSKLVPLILLLLVALASVHIDSDKVRYGNINSFDASRNDRVAVVDSKEVYLHIPAYLQIIREGVEKGSARYAQLMVRATNDYKRVLSKIGRSRYVLIVEKGGITDYPTTDATELCIKAL